MVQGLPRYSVAQELAAILVEYGERQANPVLDVLPADEAFQLNRKYPGDRVRFGQDRWRAYYHSHDSPGNTDDVEHGHFHIFHRVADEGDIVRDWTHVTALAVDNAGQPLRWFTVNNWVTGDTWVPASVLMERLDVEFNEAGLINRWLLAMLGFYREQICNMLAQRDNRLEQLQKDRNREEIFSDRDIYFLSDSPIDLLNDIGLALDQ